MVREVHVALGEQVESGTLLLVVEPADELEQGAEKSANAKAARKTRKKRKGGS